MNPEVRLIAVTDFDHTIVSDLMTWEQEHLGMPRVEVGIGDMLAEFAGRLCYWSFNRPSARTATTKDYLANIIAQQHFSVLEHASATFLLLDVSRTLTHELVRHRHLSYSQLSQRYVDESSSHTIIPVVLQGSTDPETEAIVRAIRGLQAKALELYGRINDYARNSGYNKKQARGAARSVLLGNTRTAIVVSGNFRAWREFLIKRHNTAADPEIQEVAGRIRKQLAEISPGTFQDIPVDPFGTQVEETPAGVPRVHRETPGGGQVRMEGGTV